MEQQQKQQQTYHPNNMSASKKQPAMSFNCVLVSRWCFELSKYHPTASRYLNTSWKAFLGQLLLQDIDQQAPNTLDQQQFPLLKVEHEEQPAEECDLSLLKSLLHFMLSDIGPAMIQHPLLKKQPITVVGYQLIHDLFALLPKERFGNWQVSDAPTMKITSINTASLASGSTLEALPPEILRKIFHYNANTTFHTDVSIALRLRIVSKFWRDHIVTRVFVSWTLRSSKNAINKAQLLVKLFPNLTTVNMTNVRDPVTVRSLLKIFEVVPLSCLHLFDVDEQLAGKLSGLHALRQLRIVEPVSTKELQSICLAVPDYLEVLSVNLPGSLPLEIQRLAVLRELYISQPNTCSALRDLIQIGAMGGLGMLTSYALWEDNDNDIEHDEITVPVQNPCPILMNLFPALKSLSFTRSQSRSQLTLTSVFSYAFQNLQVLKLESFVIEDALLDALQRLTFLDTLEMIACTRETKSSYKQFTLPIRQLRIDKVSAIEDPNMWLTLNFPQLKQLVMSGYNYLNCKEWREWNSCLSRICTKKKLIIDATQCNFCTHVLRNLQKRYPNTTVLYHPTFSIMMCHKQLPLLNLTKMK